MYLQDLYNDLEIFLRALKQIMVWNKPQKLLLLFLFCWLY